MGMAWPCPSLAGSQEEDHQQTQDNPWTKERYEAYVPTDQGGSGLMNR